MKKSKKIGRLFLLLMVSVLTASSLLACHGKASHTEQMPEPCTAPISANEPQEDTGQSGPEATEQRFVMPPSFEATEEDFVEPEWLKDYDSILEEYQRFVDYSIEGGAEYVFYSNVFSSPDFDLWYDWDCMVVEANIFSYRDFPKTREAFGYALQDLNGNGSPELVLMLKDYTVLAVFSMHDGKPKLMDAFWPRSKCAIDSSGLLYMKGTGGADATSYWIKQVSQDGSGLLTIVGYGWDSPENFHIISDGERRDLSKTEFDLERDRIRKEYPNIAAVNNETTRNSGLEYIPVFD